MIYVSKQQLDQVEYLIQQSIQGNHVLFDIETLRRVCVSPASNDSDSGSIIEKLILQPTLEQKRAFLEALPPETFEQVVRTYLNIVENNIFENNRLVH